MRFRSYNPGRDTRWGAARRRPQAAPSLADLGPAQRQANDDSLASTGGLLPWKRWPMSLTSMPAVHSTVAHELVRTAPDLNQMRRAEGSVYWYLRMPTWFLEEIPANEELPGDPLEQDEVRPADMRRAILAQMHEADRQGLLSDPELRPVAASIGLALIDTAAIGDALRLRIDPDRLLEEIARVAAVIPAVGQLAEYVR